MIDNIIMILIITIIEIEIIIIHNLIRITTKKKPKAYKKNKT